LNYNSTQALEQAAAMATTLATGCLRGSVELARERGSRIGNPSAGRIATWTRRGTPQRLIDDAKRWGVCHRRLTAIAAHPNLALLANNASDALDPIFATKKNLENPTSATVGSTDQVSDEELLFAQIALRGAVQPWIDAPIDYPLAYRRNAPDSRVREACRRLALGQNLPQPVFRHAQSLAIAQ